MDNTERVTLKAPDISCGGCVATVERAVGALAGVTSVTASADTQRVDVAFDAGVVSQSQIETTMAKAGFPVAT